MSQEALTGYATACFCLLLLIGAIIYSLYSSKATQRRMMEDRCKRFRIIPDANQFLALVNERKGLTVVSTSLTLKPEEYALYSAPTKLFETRRMGHSRAGSLGLQLAMASWVGGSCWRSITTSDWTMIDAGTLTLTNKRLVFDGFDGNRMIPLANIVSSSSLSDAIEVSMEGRRKSMAFSVANPLITSSILIICAKMPDPLNLCDTIYIKFV